VDDKTYSSSDSTSTFTAFTRIDLAGDIAEILIYTNLLNAADHMTTLSYLEKKWMGVSITSAVTNNLSATLAAEIKTGAVLDLCGGSQALASLSGGGRVTNGTLTVTGRLTPGDTNTVAGVLTVGGNLTLAAGATHAFDYVAGTADRIDVAGALKIEGANTVELSLNGQPPPPQMTLFTCSSISGSANLASWTVQGAGLKAYKTSIVVANNNNAVILKSSLLGSLILLK